MKLHSNAALTVKQRQEVRRLHLEQGVSIRKLAKRFGVNPTTIQRWVTRDSPLDLSTTRKNSGTVITPDYRQAVIEYRLANPRRGPISIALALRHQFAQANRGTILRILHEEKLTRPAPPQKERKRLNTGRHRIQMDIQQLPAVKGAKGFEYKISIIHMRTRVKYSEIHADCRSGTCADVLLRAMDLLPPFFSSGPTTPHSSR